MKMNNAKKILVVLLVTCTLLGCGNSTDTRDDNIRSSRSDSSISKIDSVNGEDSVGVIESPDFDLRTAKILVHQSSIKMTDTDDPQDEKRCKAWKLTEDDIVDVMRMATMVDGSEIHDLY